MFCWKCKKEVPLKKPSFREECPFCGCDLHVCKNCKYFEIGKPNECSILNIEPVLDKERYNFCEEFFPKAVLIQEKKSSLDDISKRLFGD